MRDGGAGIFTAAEDRIIPISNPDDSFESYRGALINDRGDVVFVATPRGGSPGLFAGPDPEADRILAIGDSLLGSVVEEFASNPVSVNAAGQVAVRAKFTDGRQLILRADLTATR